jgi:hypothetical protein
VALFDWLPGGSGKALRLLADYADECFVHAGAPGALSREQRDENLRVFVDSIDRRIARLQALAAALGTELPIPDGDRRKVEAISQALDHLCKSRLHGLTVIEPMGGMDWRAGEPQGPERQVQTLLVDLGAYCGEVGIRCVPKYCWVNDETRYTRKNVMRTSGRVVIGHDPAVVPTPMNNHVDVIDSAAFALSQVVHFRKAKGHWRPNYFHFLSDLADGRYV